eukprot:41765_1
MTVRDVEHPKIDEIQIVFKKREAWPMEIVSSMMAIKMVTIFSAFELKTRSTPVSRIRINSNHLRSSHKFAEFCLSIVAILFSIGYKIYKKGLIVIAMVIPTVPYIVSYFGLELPSVPGRAQVFIMVQVIIILFYGIEIAFQSEVEPNIKIKLHEAQSV